MALSEQQEKELLEGFGGLKKTVEELKPIAAKVPELENTLKAKDAEIAELKKNQTNFSQEAQFHSLKTKYPDVPEDTLKALPEASRDSVAAGLQAQFSKLKATQAKTDPMTLWANAGGIGPTDEAEKAAQKAEAQKRYDSARNNGNVMGMLQTRSAEVVSFLRKSFAKA